MTLKRKVEKLEKIIGEEADLEKARGFVMFGMRFGLLPETIDFEEMVKACASKGISLGTIIDEILQENTGLPRLPSQAED
jgi:hypothetical protein